MVVRSSDLDVQFHMDGVDDYTLYEAREPNEEGEDEEEMVPLKESSRLASDQVLGQAESGTRPRKMASLVQNVPYHHPGKSRQQPSRQIPNSLPIKIPQFQKKLDVDDEVSRPNSSSACVLIVRFVSTRGSSPV